jgi:hypothetical protein
MIKLKNLINIILKEDDVSSTSSDSQQQPLNTINVAKVNNLRLQAQKITDDQIKPLSLKKNTLQKQVSQLDTQIAKLNDKASKLRLQASELENNNK